jgi:hypothetical protein
MEVIQPTVKRRRKRVQPRASDRKDHAVRVLCAKLVGVQRDKMILFLMMNPDQLWERFKNLQRAHKHLQATSKGPSMRISATKPLGTTMSVAAIGVNTICSGILYIEGTAIVTAIFFRVTNGIVCLGSGEMWPVGGRIMTIRNYVEYPYDSVELIIK